MIKKSYTLIFSLMLAGSSHTMQEKQNETELNQKFAIAIFCNEEAEAIELLRLGANPNQKITVERQCYCPENTLSQPYDTIPLIRFIISKNMQKLLAAIEEKKES